MKLSVDIKAEINSVGTLQEVYNLSLEDILVKNFELLFLNANCLKFDSCYELSRSYSDHPFDVLEDFGYIFSIKLIGEVSRFGPIFQILKLFESATSICGSLPPVVNISFSFDISG